MGGSEGMRWRVGNGKNVKVWSDPWVPNTQTRHVLSHRENSPADLEVGALSDPITRSSNKQLVEQLFLPFEYDRVLSIPLSTRMPDDCLCWELENNDEYTIRSAYRALARDEWNREAVGDSNP